MIIGVHAIVFTRQAEAVRRFFGEVLGLDSVDAGGGWPIYALPPAEIAVHPWEGDDKHELYLLCDDLDGMVRELEAKGVGLARAITEEDWGRSTAIAIPGAGEIALYQPKHPRPQQ